MGLHLIPHVEVNVFSLREYSENNENYIEVPLVFDPVIREDLNTDFKCLVRNTLSFQTLRTTVKEGMYLGNVQGEKQHGPCSADARPSCWFSRGLRGQCPVSSQWSTQGRPLPVYDLFFVGWELALGDYVQVKT